MANVRKSTNVNGDGGEARMGVRMFVFIYMGRFQYIGNYPFYGIITRIYDSPKKIAKKIHSKLKFEQWRRRQGGLKAPQIPVIRR